MDILRQADVEKRPNVVVHFWTVLVVNAVCDKSHINFM